MGASMFSKRHYEAVAAVLREACPHTRGIRPLHGVGYPLSDQWALIRDALADLFEADNPLDGKGRGFKRDKWEEVCER